MLEAMIEEGPEVNPIMILCLKEPEGVRKTMNGRITLEYLQGADMRRDYKGRDGQSLVRLFKYRHPFTLHLW